jgi:hypothetical protein
MPTLAVLLLASLPPAPSAEDIPTLDLGTLTYQQARNLEGRPVRVAFVVECVDWPEPGKGVFVEAAGKSGLARYVWFAPGAGLPALKVGRRLEVHPALRLADEWFPKTVEVIVEDARPARP